MDLTSEEKKIVNVMAAELGRRLALAGVPDERWSLVTAALVCDISQQSVDLSGVPAELERTIARLAKVLGRCSEPPPAAKGG